MSGGFFEGLFGESEETEQTEQTEKNSNTGSNAGNTDSSSKSNTGSSSNSKSKKFALFLSGYRKGLLECNKKNQTGGKKKKSKSKKSKSKKSKSKKSKSKKYRRSSKKKTIKSGATVYSHDDIVSITNIIDNLRNNWFNKDRHNEYKMELKDYFKTRIDPPFTDEQFNKIVNIIAENRSGRRRRNVDDDTRYQLIRSWINLARGITSGSKKKKKTKRKKISIKNKHLRTSKIKKIRSRNK